jgi:putative ABC transport system permease protein
VEGLHRPLLLVQGAALLVLLLACANVAALLLARTMARERELATRAALGAGGPRLAMHVLTECLALAMLAGLLGIVLAHGGVALLALAFPDGVPSYVDLRLQPGAVALALLLAVGTAALFGLLPAWRVGRTRSYTTLFGSGRTTAPAGRGWAFPALVVAQVALAVLLLGVAALLARTYQALEESLGFEPEGVLAVTVQLPPRQYPSAARRAEFFAQLEERLRGLPGVAHASASVSAAPSTQGSRRAGGASASRGRLRRRRPMNSAPRANSWRRGISRRSACRSSRDATSALTTQRAAPPWPSSTRRWPAGTFRMLTRSAGG